MAPAPEISIIVPVLNDARALATCLHALELPETTAELLVVDGGSEDGSDAIARADPRATLLVSPPGRGRQLQTGLRAARGRLVLFLHADTRLPNDWVDLLQAAAARPRFAFGAFRLALAAPGLFFRLLEAAVDLRNRGRGLPYGDQAIFATRALLREAGGVPTLPLLEDLVLVKKLRASGRYVYLRKHAATTSARRWLAEGPLRRSLRNALTRAGYALGVPPETLRTFYAGPTRAIGIFCKHPTPGRVKTRLATHHGAEYAARLYRRLVEHTLAEVRQCPSQPRLYLFFDPPEQSGNFESWLGSGLTYRPQRGRDLGERMFHALREMAADGCSHLLLVGTDCPGLSPDTAEQAFRLLNRHDVVLGPSEDGGYYLLGARPPVPNLFGGVAWSTATVLAETLERLRRERLRCRLLSTLRDLDDGEDWRYFRDRGVLASLKADA